MWWWIAHLAMWAGVVATAAFIGYIWGWGHGWKDGYQQGIADTMAKETPMDHYGSREAGQHMGGPLEPL
jgi:hypothetical protein